MSQYMADVWELLAIIGAAGLSASIAAIVAVLGYRHISKAQRDFERDKTRFHEKLKAYKEVLESLDGVLMVFTSFKGFMTCEWKTDTPEELNESIISMITILAQMKEKEKVIGGAAIEKVIDWYNEKVGPLEGSKKVTNEATEQWLFDATVTSSMTLIRLLEHYSGKLIAALDTIGILAEGEEVLQTAGMVHAWLVQDAAQLVTFMDGESPPLMKRQEILVKLPQFDILARQLRVAMRKDLDDTMRSEY
jgi:hypothetical protein